MPELERASGPLPAGRRRSDKTQELSLFEDRSVFPAAVTRLAALGLLAAAPLAYADLAEREQARLNDLRQSPAGEGGAHFAGWLAVEIAAVEARLAWFKGLRERVGR